MSENQSNLIESPSNPMNTDSDNEVSDDFIKLMEYPNPSKDNTKDLIIYVPSQDSVQIDNEESELAIDNDELLNELKKQNTQIKAMLDDKQKECEKNYNKAETVSLMTKYQMIFVKIEIYLTNFSSIIQNYNIQHQRVAFANIKAKYLREKKENIIKGSIMILKLRRPLMIFKKIFDSKNIVNKACAFEKIAAIKKNENMKVQFKERFDLELNSLKSFLFTKKEEQDSVVKTYDDSRIYLQKSRKSNPNIISSTKVKSENESFKLATADAKKIQKKITKGKDLNKKLKVSLKATEDKVHKFIFEVNDMIDNQADLFIQDERFSDLFKEFWNTKENQDSQKNHGIINQGNKASSKSLKKQKNKFD